MIGENTYMFYNKWLLSVESFIYVVVSRDQHHGRENITTNTDNISVCLNDFSGVCATFAKYMQVGELQVKMHRSKVSLAHHYTCEPVVTVDFFWFCQAMQYKLGE